MPNSEEKVPRYVLGLLPFYIGPIGNTGKTIWRAWPAITQTFYTRSSRDFAE